MVKNSIEDTQYAEVAIACPLRQCFDYAIPHNMRLHPGMRVKIPFGRRLVTGMILTTKTQTNLTDLKTILEVLDNAPIIPPELIELDQWVSHYYHHPIGDVVMGTLPTRLRQGKTLNVGEKISLLEAPIVPQKQSHTLNLEQQYATDYILKKLDAFHVFLLHGITGSGKTEVYFRIIEATLKKQKQVLFLIPEISLSPQTVTRFQERFSGIFVMHSGLTDKRRLITWAHARDGNANIIIGTRSAIFTPFKNLGLILIDEEHDASFKQQEGFRYSARDVAIKRAKNLNIPIILGSATPSIESYYHALNNKYHLLELTQRAGQAILPEFNIVHATPKTCEKGFTAEALQRIEQHLARQEQVLIFVNRRGYAPTWFCQSCGWQADCTRCDSHLVLHKKDKKLICHHCGHQSPLMHRCLQCQSHSLLALGEGTQRIEETLQTLFSSIPLVRVDRDTVKNKHQLETQLNSIHQENAALLIGTQMLAKGHHFPKVTLVVILGIDNGLMSNDFHALEQTAQLIMQVAGRAGRVDRPGTVLLQTLQPDHPHLQLLTQQPYGIFLKTLLKERQQFGLPPFWYLALFRSEAKQSEKAFQALLTVTDFGKKMLQDDSNIIIYDPVPAPMHRKAGFHHYQLLMKSSKRSSLHHFLSQLLIDLSKNKQLRTVRWSVEIDPLNLI